MILPSLTHETSLLLYINMVVFHRHVRLPKTCSHWKFCRFLIWICAFQATGHHQDRSWHGRTVPLVVFSWIMMAHKPHWCGKSNVKNLQFGVEDFWEVIGVHFLFGFTTYSGIYNSCVPTWSWVLWSFSTMPISPWDWLPLKQSTTHHPKAMGRNKTLGKT